MTELKPKKMMLAVALACAGSLSLAGCGLLGDRDPTSREAQTRALEVPPDLIPPSVDPSFRIPEIGEGRVAASQMPAGQRESGITQTATVARVLPVPDGMEIRREGSVRYLHVNAAADELWPAMRNFFREQGLALTVDAPERGVFETDWVQTRAGLPQEGGLRSLIARVFGDGYDANMRNQFRVRVEPESAEASSIFVSHRGAEEVAEREDLIRWAMVPADPEAEAQMLVQIMNHLAGIQTDEPAATGMQFVDVGPAVRLVSDATPPYVEVQGEFEPTWRRLGVMLDRASLLVDDVDRSNGIYYVTYRPERDQAERTGFLGRVFSREDLRVDTNTQFRIIVREFEGLTRITVQNQQGEPASQRENDVVLTRIRDQFGS
ncbi:Beta-barrel assembly machine subunit BamC [Ectothiorhodosinus mongolicus]|uniref:Beta-barrel assembly machine subunit BamC n=1 Tax=Ectothiorhodosinus mongolicus TaxID=233100 RepID=A0A1R3W0U2_9GAMM|nr:outer membrane protein assembly factor BamC [Ectothiorhodosinus mongolicus]ULX57325.1 outer membrane protein assembly factor BamC [Ectothiorhodosinus mongolicus]SIT70978.1 Beta-barrel assembly machine subunit BamC [Ectothiorhodosinus mongolicus]